MTPRSWSARWNRIKTDVTLQDLGQDVLGKVLVALGLGALFAQALLAYAGVLIAVGLLLSVVVKAKYWKRFWS